MEILDRDSHCPYILSGETTTLHHTSMTWCTYLQFQENTAMRVWVTVRKLNGTDGRTDRGISISPGPLARREITNKCLKMWQRPHEVICTYMYISSLSNIWFRVSSIENNLCSLWLYTSVTTNCKQMYKIVQYIHFRNTWGHWGPFTYCFITVYIRISLKIGMYIIQDIVQVPDVSTYIQNLQIWSRV